MTKKITLFLDEKTPKDLKAEGEILLSGAVKE